MRQYMRGVAIRCAFAPECWSLPELEVEGESYSTPSIEILYQHVVAGLLTV